MAPLAISQETRAGDGESLAVRGTEGRLVVNRDDAMSLVEAALGHAPRAAAGFQDRGIHDIFRNHVVAFLSWNSAIGRPDTATLAEAFTATYDYCPPRGPHGEPRFPDNPEDWIDAGAPEAHDGADSGRLTVAFVAGVAPPGISRMSIRLRADVTWSPGDLLVRSRPVVVPPEQRFEPTQGYYLLEFNLVAPIFIEERGHKFLP